MEPINYMAQMPQQNFLQNFNQGLQTAAVIGQMSEQSRAREQQVKAKEDLKTFFAKPNKTAEDYSEMMVMYPSLQEGLSASYKTVNEAKKQNDFGIAAQVSGALNSGNTDLAKQILTKEKEAYANSGDTKSATNMDNILNTIDTNPKGALEFSNMFMASIYPDRFKDTYEGIVKTNIEKEQSPYDLLKKKAEIFKLKTEAEQMPIETNIKLGQLAINKEESKIKMMEAQAKNTDNALKREELLLKINDKKREIEKVTRETEQANNTLISDAQTSFDTINNTTSTIDNILNSKGLEKATGASSFLSMIPGTEAKDTAAMVDTLKSQAFMSEIQKMKGLGALSENEGKKVTDALGSLDLGQSTAQFKKTLETIKTTLDKSKINLSTKFKTQLDKGNVSVNPQTQQNTSQQPATNIDDLLKKYGAK